MSDGNGAREALIDILSPRAISQKRAAGEADFILADLWAHGFKVIPLESADDQERR